MRTVIIRAIAKTTKENAKTNHVPFYKGITPTTATTTAIPTTALDTKDVYTFVLRYVVEKYAPVKYYDKAFVKAAERFSNDLKKLKKYDVLDNFTADSYVYKFMWFFFDSVKENYYPWSVGDDIKNLRKNQICFYLSNNYFKRYMLSAEND